MKHCFNLIDFVFFQAKKKTKIIFLIWAPTKQFRARREFNLENVLSKHNNIAKKMQINAFFEKVIEVVILLVHTSRLKSEILAELKYFSKTQERWQITK